MPKHVVHSFSGGPYDPRLAEPAGVVGKLVKGFSSPYFVVEIADSWSVACPAGTTAETSFSLHTFPACGAPILGQTESVLEGPMLIFGAQLHILKNSTAGTTSGTTAPNVFASNFGFQKTAFTDVSSSQVLFSRAGAAISPTFTNVSSVWTAAHAYASGSINNTELHLPSAGGGSGVNFSASAGYAYLSGTTPWAFGMTVGAGRSGAGSAPLVFEGVVYLFGMLMPPLRTDV